VHLEENDELQQLIHAGFRLLDGEKGVRKEENQMLLFVNE
jgi:hypothetical protein